MTRTSHRPPRAAGRAGRTNLFRFAVPLHPTTAHFHLQPQHRSTFSHFNIFTFSHFPYIRGTVKLGVRAPRESTSLHFPKNFVIRIRGQKTNINLWFSQSALIVVLDALADSAKRFWSRTSRKAMPVLGVGMGAAAGAAAELRE